MSNLDEEKTPSEGDPFDMFERAVGLLDESKHGYDPTRGGDLMRRAAEAGLAMAQVQYGVLCYYGKGVPKDHEAAFGWYARSLETGGHTWGGGFNIGDLHDDSDEFPKNPIEAAAWFALSLEVKEGPGRLAALLPQFGQADVARVVARAMTIVQMMQDKAYDERLRPVRGLSLEPPEGPHPEDTPVTLLSVLIPLHAALTSKYTLDMLVHELRSGDSMLYGAFKLLNPQDHAKGQPPMVEPEFTRELMGEPVALLYSSRFNCIFDRPGDDVTPVAMPSQRYLEMMLQMEVRKLRLDQALFGEVTLDLSKVPAAPKGTATDGERAPRQDELDETLPDPPPFRVTFPHEGKTYVAECFPEVRERPKLSESEPQIVEFGPRAAILRVTLDGAEQDAPGRFEEAIVNHLNRAPGMRDGDFPEGQLMAEEAFRDDLFFNFTRNVGVLRNGSWELARSPDAPRFGIAAVEHGNPDNAVLFNVEPRGRARTGFVTALIKLREAQFRRFENVLLNDREFVSGLLDRFKVAPEITSGTWYETDGLDETTGRARRKFPEGQGEHPLLRFHMGKGLSAQDQEGAERLANIMARLFLIIQELERHSLRSGNHQN